MFEGLIVHCNNYLSKLFPWIIISTRIINLLTCKLLVCRDYEVYKVRTFCLNVFVWSNLNNVSKGNWSALIWQEILIGWLRLTYIFVEYEASLHGYNPEIKKKFKVLHGHFKSSIYINTFKLFLKVLDNFLD